jgi:hypothetical protein
MDVVTINVGAKKSIDVVCSKCGNKRQVIVAKLSNFGVVYKIKCQCTHDFSIAFDRRQHRRKKTKLPGTYTLHNKFGDYIINIIDLSRGGLAFTRTDKNELAIGDMIHVQFILDNLVRDSIECMAIVRHVCDNRICVEFLNMIGRMQTTLGFYFV